MFRESLYLPTQPPPSLIAMKITFWLKTTYFSFICVSGAGLRDLVIQIYKVRQLFSGRKAKKTTNICIESQNREHNKCHNLEGTNFGLFQEASGKFLNLRSHQSLVILAKLAGLLGSREKAVRIYTKKIQISLKSILLSRNIFW